MDERALKQAEKTFMKMLSGAWRFALVSVLAFSVWAFGGRMKEWVLYSLVAVAFLGLSGALMFPLLKGQRRLLRFYQVFLPGFLLYAILWCAGWFGVGGPEGEIIGSALGLAAMTGVIVGVLKIKKAFLPVFAVLFLCHTIGYNLGGLSYYATHGQGVLAPVLEGQVTLGRLLWGLFYGLGFGAGLGYAFGREAHGSALAVECLTGDER